jgi:hypothetical protein
MAGLAVVGAGGGGRAGGQPAVVVGAGSLVVRFRRARGTERQQLRWVALAAALTLLGSLVLLAAVTLGTSPAVLGWVAGVYVAILPLAIGGVDPALPAV